MAEQPTPTEPEHLTARVDVRIAGTQVRFDVTVPTAPVPSGAILPVFQTLSAAIQADVARGLEEEGKTISCRAGCGACCRQLVPISKIEARRLSELVESMPEPRRTEVRARFADVIRRIEEAGLLETLRRPEWAPPESKEALALKYFDLGIPCPFLVDESCSIHEDRPLVCREFLVTSPPEYCATPASKLVEGVKLLVRMSNYLVRFGESTPPGPGSWVILPLALEWTANHPDDAPRQPGPRWVELLFQMIAKEPVGDAARSAGRAPDAHQTEQ